MTAGRSGGTARSGMVMDGQPELQALSLLALGRYDDAERAGSELLGGDPDSGVGLFASGVAKLARGDVDAAVDVLGRLVATHPGFNDAYPLLASALLLQRR